MIESIINKLSQAQLNGKKLFKHVEEAIDMQTVLKSKLQNSPTAYVVEISRRPGRNVRDMGNAMQNVATTVGVIIGISKVNDPKGNKAKAIAEPILKETRKVLFGFVPFDGCEPMLLGAADTVGTSDHALWKLERFTTEHLEEASQ